MAVAVLVNVDFGGGGAECWLVTTAPEPRPCETSCRYVNEVPGAVCPLWEIRGISAICTASRRSRCTSFCIARRACVAAVGRS